MKDVNLTNIKEYIKSHVANYEHHITEICKNDSGKTHLYVTVPYENMCLAITITFDRNQKKYFGDVIDENGGEMISNHIEIIDFSDVEFLTNLLIKPHLSPNIKTVNDLSFI